MGHRHRRRTCAERICCFLAFVLDDTGPEAKHTLTVSILIFTIVNLILVVVIGKEKYDIIAKCIFAFLAVGSLITTFIAFNDMSPILGWLNLVLTVLNGGAFLFLILGSYEVLMNFINPVLEFFKKGNRRHKPGSRRTGGAAADKRKNKEKY